MIASTNSVIGQLRERAEVQREATVHEQHGVDPLGVAVGGDDRHEASHGVAHDGGRSDAQVVEHRDQVVRVRRHAVRPGDAVAATPPAQIRGDQRGVVGQLVGERLERHVVGRHAVRREDVPRPAPPPTDPQTSAGPRDVERLVPGAHRTDSGPSAVPFARSAARAARRTLPASSRKRLADALERARDLVRREAFVEVDAQFRVGHLALEFQQRVGNLAEILVGQRDDHRRPDSRVLHQGALHLRGIDVGTAHDQHVALAVGEVDVALVIDGAHVADRLPPLAHRPGVGADVAVRAGLAEAPAHPDLADLARRERRTRGVEHLHLPDDGTPDGAGVAEPLRSGHDGHRLDLRGRVQLPHPLRAEPVDPGLLQPRRAWRRHVHDHPERRHVVVRRCCSGSRQIRPIIVGTAYM